MPKRSLPGHDDPQVIFTPTRASRQLPWRRAIPAKTFVGLVLAALMIASCSVHSHRGPVDDRLEGPAGRIAYAYHGTLLDADFNEIDLERDDILQIQGSLIDNLLQGLSAKKRRKLRALVTRALEAEDWNPTETLIVNDALLGRLLAAAPETTGQKVRWRRRLVTDARFRVEGFDVGPLTPNSRLGAFLRQASLFRFFLSPPADPRPDGFDSPTFDTPYMAECRSNDVPIPPDWGNPGWKRQGELPAAATFALPGLAAEAWAYQDPNGTCLALPRRNASDTILFMGIICQSDRTGKACFWDNIDRQTGEKITGIDPTIRIAALEDGSNLDENCTQCHRGRNAFLIHPKTALDLSVPFNTNPRTRYQPISRQSGWQNPPARFEWGDGACARCHEIPALTPKYCGVLRKAAQRSMPSPATPALGRVPPCGFVNQLRILGTECSWPERPELAPCDPG